MRRWLALLLAAAFRQESEEAPSQNQAEDEQCGGDEARQSIQGEEFAPTLGLKRDLKRAEREDSGEEQGKKETPGHEAETLLGVERAHEAAT